MKTTTLQTDYYKTNHYKMYPKGTNKVYSNLTPRKSRMKGVNEIVVFGIQYFIKEYLELKWNKDFFNKPADMVLQKYKRMMDYTLGKDSVDIDHIKKLHEIGYLPLEIKALPEGSICPIGVPCLTITNTIDHAYWLVNYLETIMSCTLWQPMTSATIAHHYKKLLDSYVLKTAGNTEFTPWQGHDFSFRGMSSLESACLSGAGHLLSFTGTDTIPAIEFLETYYNANVEKELVGASVPATEHSIMAMGLKDSEIETFENLLNLYPAGILSVVSDTWSLTNVTTKILPQLKDKIMSRNGKLVIRPDSFYTNPADCLCGYDEYHPKMKDMNPEEVLSIRKGLIETLWDLFGGITNELGYKVLDSHIGAIYGDSITYDIAKEICERLEKKGFASTNVVLGIGSYTYQYNTRDTFGFAVKATYGEVNGVGREIFKDPITDTGFKKSAKGLLIVQKDEFGRYELIDQVSKQAEENSNELKTVFLNGKLIKDWTLAEVRNNLVNATKFELEPISE